MDPEQQAPASGLPLPLPLPLARPPAGSVVVRALLIVVGTVALGIGLVGLVVPVLPTTPFLLLAAACYARASTRLFAWLLGWNAVGSIILAWRHSRALPAGTRRRAIATVVVVFAISIVLVDDVALRVALLAIGLLVAAFLFWLPEAESGHRDARG